jgi:Zn-finger nucleic acid-binding protein
MHCPHCPDTALQMTDRQGIEIDYCPRCRGVWLDRGELDKLIERSVSQAAPAMQAPRSHSPPQSHHAPYPNHGKRKSSWLSELSD